MLYEPYATVIDRLAAKLGYTVGFGNHETCVVFHGATLIVEGGLPHVLMRLRQMRDNRGWEEEDTRP